MALWRAANFRREYDERTARKRQTSQRGECISLTLAALGAFAPGLAIEAHISTGALQESCNEARVFSISVYDPTANGKEQGIFLSTYFFSLCDQRPARMCVYPPAKYFLFATTGKASVPGVLFWMDLGFT